MILVCYESYADAKADCGSLNLKYISFGHLHKFPQMWRFNTVERSLL